MFKEIYESIDINAVLAVVITAIIIPTLKYLEIGIVKHSATYIVTERGI